MKKLFLTVAVTFIGMGILLGFQSTALAGKAKFDARVVTRMPLSLKVNTNGGITGNMQATVSATRTKVGSSAACNKIRLLDVVDGGSPSAPSLGTHSLGRKGLCYFTNKTILVKPFSEDEIKGACENVSGVTQRLSKDALVVAHNTPWEPSYLDLIRE